MSSSAIIIAAVILGIVGAVGSILVFLGLLHNARAQDAMATALAKRNEIEAKKTDDGLRAFGEVILRTAEERAFEMDQQLAAGTIAGKELWRHESGAQGRVSDDATVVVQSDERDARRGDRQEPRPERGERYNDVSHTTVTNTRDLQTLGYEVRVEGHHYHEMPFNLEGATHPGQIAANRHLAQQLWDFGHYWMRHTTPTAHPDQRLYHPHPEYAGHTWYDTFRAMFAKTYGFGLYANITDQFPRLEDSPQHPQSLDEQHDDGHAPQ